MASDHLTETATLAYEQKIDRAHPACIMFLLDQSGSMNDTLADGTGRSKAQALTDAVHELLQSIVRRCVKERNAPPRHYYDIGVIGYGRHVRSMFSDALSGRTLASVEELANAVVTMTERDGVRRPVWFEPVADGWTPMCAAFDLAGQVIAGWMQAHHHCFPAIIINVTDGVATTRDTHGDACRHPGTCDPQAWGERMRSLTNQDGNVLLFTIHMSAKGQTPISFPSSPEGLPDDYSRLLFHMSSELPDFMRQRAADLGVPTAPGARGFVRNADMGAVVRALEVGTSLDALEGA